MLMKQRDVKIFIKSVRMKIIFMGTPEFAVSVLQGLMDNGYSIAGVYTRPDQGRGRGQTLAISAVKRIAMAHQLPVFQPGSLRSAVEQENLRLLDPDLVAVAAYGLILPREVLVVPRYGCLNVHPSLLPRHRGPAPVTTAILAGDAVAGVTIMLLDEGMDTGPILAQKEAPVLPEDTTGSLTARLAKLGTTLLLETIPQWVEGKIGPVPQDESKATYSKTLQKEDGRIDWTKNAGYIARQIRAFQPWPGSYAVWEGRRLQIIKATAKPETAAELPGKVIAVDRGKGSIPAVVTGQGTIVLETVQLEGKKEISGGDFVRGQRTFVGSVLASSPERTP